eukprot:10484703-Alexandrium_andersonii.AAC.1
MSASLVGSEMCIRDSTEDCGHPSTLQSPLAKPASKRMQGKRHDRAAVSYTHLTLPTICSV